MARFSLGRSLRVGTRQPHWKGRLFALLTIEQRLKHFDVWYASTHVRKYANPVTRKGWFAHLNVGAILIVIRNPVIETQAATTFLLPF
jgi:hypothetical protein